MSATMDKMQRGIMMVVPLVFIGVVAHFPAGLVIYWVTTNLWTVGQGLVTRRLVPTTPLAAGALGRPEALVADAGEGRARAHAEAGRRRRRPRPSRSPQQPRRVKRKKGGARR